MNKKTSSTILTLLLLATAVLALTFQRAEGDVASPPFSDDFVGTQIDAKKWVAQENTELSGLPAYGGSIKVADGKIALSSTGSSFPYVYSATNPFPTSGDFAIEVSFTYTHVGIWGNGLWVSTEPWAYNSTVHVQKCIFSVWADDENTYDKAAIRATLLGKEVYQQEIHGALSVGLPATTHVFRLEHFKGLYTLLVDGVEVASELSESIPLTVGFGHPPISYIPFSDWRVAEMFANRGGWTSFEIDYIRILRQASVSLSTSTSNVKLGFSVDVNGNLLSADGQPLSGDDVIISYKFPGIAKWTPATSAVTASDGSYFATWLPTATGSFTLKAEWLGNEIYAGTYDVKNVSVTRDSDNLLLAESNSTLSSLVLNPDSNEISFSVSGPSGTSGYVRFLVSKSLVPDIASLKVYLDGRQIEYSSSSVGDLQLLYFSYTHSAHDVIVRLPEASFSSSSSADTAGSDIRIIIAAFLIVIAIIVILGVWRLRKE